jgi:hypothetical protein
LGGAGLGGGGLGGAGLGGGGPGGDGLGDGGLGETATGRSSVGTYNSFFVFYEGLPTARTVGKQDSCSQRQWQMAAAAYRADRLRSKVVEILQLATTIATGWPKSWTMVCCL